MFCVETHLLSVENVGDSDDDIRSKRKARTTRTTRTANNMSTAAVAAASKLLINCGTDPLLYKGIDSVACLALQTFLAKGLTLKRLASFASKVPTIFPWDVQYGNSRFNVNHRFNVLPLMIVVATTEKHVIKALRFSNKYKIEISLRGGRHCAENFSLSSGMIIDQGQRQCVQVDAKNRTMIVQPGVLIGPTIAELWNKYRLFVPSGLCSSVALNGLVLGGGMGFSQRQYGLTCDSLLEVSVVLANGGGGGSCGGGGGAGGGSGGSSSGGSGSGGHGSRSRSRQVVASNKENTDLFWALRGAGNGNFGIVTSLKFQLYPVENVTVIELTFAFCQLKKVWRTFQRLAYKLPREITLELNVATQTSNDPGAAAVAAATMTTATVAAAATATTTTAARPLPKLSIIGQSFATAKDTRKILSPLLTLCQEHKIESMTYPDAARSFGAGLSRLPFYKNKNAFINTTRWPSTAIETIGRAFSSSDAPPDSVLELDAMGGAIKDVAPTGTAFVARDQKYWMLLQTNWSQETSAARHVGWITDLYQRLSPHFSGLVYANQPDVAIKDYLTAYYGQNVPRLIQVKTAVDPTNVFKFQQSIPTAVE